MYCKMTTAIANQTTESTRPGFVAKLLIPAVWATLGWVNAVQAQNLTLDMVSPPVMLTNSPTTLTVATMMVDPNYVPVQINLLRDGTTVLGSLTDDGTGGDDEAGDDIYTLATTIQEASETTVMLTLSATFEGLSGTFYSPPYTLEVLDDPILCPAPASVTLDSDGTFTLPDVTAVLLANEGIFSHGPSNTIITQTPPAGSG